MRPNISTHLVGARAQEVRLRRRGKTDRGAWEETVNEHQAKCEGHSREVKPTWIQDSARKTWTCALCGLEKSEWDATHRGTPMPGLVYGRKP
jgi:hypothetical protein